MAARGVELCVVGALPLTDVQSFAHTATTQDAVGLHAAKFPERLPPVIYVSVVLCFVHDWEVCVAVCLYLVLS